MNQRLTALAGALLALSLLIIMIAPPTGPQVPVSQPTSSDAGEFGLLGLMRWLEQGPVPVQALRRRYDALVTADTLTERGNLLIISLPQRYPARDKELKQMADWVAAGNHVLLLAAQGDRPAWAASRFGSHLNQVLSPLGLRIQAPRDPDEEAAGEDDEGSEDETEEDEPQPGGLRAALELAEKLKGEPRTLAPAGGHPALAGIKAVTVQAWPLLADNPLVFEGTRGRRAALRLLQDVTTGHAALWELRHGDGRVWVSRYSDLFGNVRLGEADNARLLANLLGLALGPGGTVIFDDMHQGESELYDPDAFFGDSRLHHTLWFIFGFWVLYVVGRSNRLAPLRTSLPATHGVDFVRATGGLFARRLTPAATGRALFMHFFDGLRRRHGLPTNGQPAWELLAASARVDRRDLQALRDGYAALDSKTPVDLVQLLNLMHKLRSALV